jgi:hypothetical protein
LAYLGQRTIRERARQVIYRLISLVPTESLPELDRALRSWYLPQWYDQGIDGISVMDSQSTSDQVCLAFLCCHWNGYVRGAAVRAMSNVAAEIAIPFLMLRLVDWVEPVHAVAEAELRRRLVPENGRVLVRCLGLLERLSGHARFRSEYWEWIEALLRELSCADALRAGMRSDVRAVRRRSWRIASGEHGI